MLIRVRGCEIKLFIFPPLENSTFPMDVTAPLIFELHATPGRESRNPPPLMSAPPLAIRCNEPYLLPRTHCLANSKVIGRGREGDDKIPCERARELRFWELSASPH